MLQVRIEELDGNIILHCAGRIVRGHETSLLCAASGQSGRNIVVDLSQVDAIDAAGIGALIALQAAGVYLRLANPTHAVRQVLSVTRLDSIFEICIMPLMQHSKEEDQEEATRQSRGSAHFLPAVAAAS